MTTRDPAALRSLSLLLALFALPAAAQEPVYLDDRSDPAAIVRSFYNAVTRKEYARAWSYYGERKPVADYAAFVAGYGDTEAVTLATGPVTTEGAAGSIYGTVPVAIEATHTDGTTHAFAGCVTTRQIQPGIQEPPFQPLLIDHAVLHAASAAVNEALPESCPPE